MFRSPWELDSYIRHHHEHLASERQRSAQVARADGGSPGLLTRLRRWLGIGLIRVGATIAGRDALRARTTPPAWPDLAHR